MTANGPKRTGGMILRQGGFIAIFLLLSLLGAVAAEPLIYQVPYDPLPTYSPTATTQVQGVVTLESNHYTGPVCLVFTELSRTPTPQVPQESVDYGLFSANGVSRLSVDGSPATAQETLTGSFPSGSKKHDRITLPFLVDVFPSNLPAPGLYRITLRANLYSSSYPPSGAIADSVIFYVSVQVGGFYDVSVMPSGGTYSVSSTTTALDFGILQPDVSKGADLLVKANIPYALSLSSANGSALVNPSDGSKVPYSLASNGTPVLLSAGAQTLAQSGASQSYAVPTRYALLATILSFSQLPTEGSFSDTITIILSAR